MKVNFKCPSCLNTKLVEVSTCERQVKEIKRYGVLVLGEPEYFQPQEYRCSSCHYPIRHSPNNPKELRETLKKLAKTANTP